MNRAHSTKRPPAPSYDAKQFIVYFPFKPYVLTPEAQTVVSEAANYTRTDQAASRVVVVGHADTSGSAAYNVRLSERRAKAVADALEGPSGPCIHTRIRMATQRPCFAPVAEIQFSARRGR